MTDLPTNLLQTPINKTRLEFLYDGIFAIAMTILALELKVPELDQRRSGMELLRKLGHDAPAFGSWLLSILMLGIFWYHHQRMYRWLERITKASLAVHLGLMATAAFFPFCAALIGRLPGNRGAMLVYMGCAWLHFTLVGTLWILAERQKTLSPQLGPAEIKRIRKRYLRGPIALLVWAICYFLFISRL